MKKRLFISSLLLLLANTVCASETFHVYAPSRTGECLLVTKATVGDNAITFSDPQRVDLGFSATTITAHPNLPLLYVSTNRGEPGASAGAVTHLNADNSVASHKPLKLQHGYSYLSLDRTSRFLLGNNYGGGQVDVYALDASGNLGKRVAFLNEGRKAAHCVWPSPDNRFVYVPYVKDSNALFQYAFNPTTGALTPLEPKNAQPPEGTGPRHIAYHPTLPIVYFSNEQAVGASSYTQKKNGQLTIHEVVNAFPAGTNTDGLSSSDIIITPDGRHLFVGIRGHKQAVDAIARYAVNAKGDLTLLGRTPADAIPWGLALSPDGKHLLATGFKAGTLMAFSITNDGDLQRTGTLAWDQSVSDLITR